MLTRRSSANQPRRHRGARAGLRTHLPPKRPGSREGVQHARHHLTGTGLAGRVPVLSASSSSAFTSTTPSRLFSRWNNTSTVSGSAAGAKCPGLAGRAAWLIERSATRAALWRVRRGRHFGARSRRPSAWRSGLRHSESAKIRTDPPAVLTYSTLPLVDPVVDGTSADPYVLARLQDRQSLTIANHGPLPPQARIPLSFTLSASDPGQL